MNFDDPVITELARAMAPPYLPQLRALTAVINERKRQRIVEGYSSVSDDNYKDGQLADAAACYAYASSYYAQGREPPDAIALERRQQGRVFEVFDRVWPWRFNLFKPRASLPTLPAGSKIDPRVHQKACLVKAGALILAELERLDRMS